jgi:hypothetical protein
MTALEVSAGPAMTRPAKELSALARYEIRRYARHPLFLAGVALTALTGYLYLHTTLTDPGGPQGYPGTFLGVFGIVIGFRLTQSMRSAAEVVVVTPASPQLRTGAVCLAAAVPFATGVLTLAAILLFQHPAGAWTYGAYGPSDRFAVLASQVVVLALGGPLLGIVVARWVPYDWSLPVLIVAVMVWFLVVSTVNSFYPNALLSVLLRMLSPGAWFMGLDNAPRQVETYRGSPWFFIGWQLSLCAIAVLVALRRDADARWRRPLRMTMAVVGVLAIAIYLLAATGGLDHAVAVRPDGSVVPL